MNKICLNQFGYTNEQTVIANIKSEEPLFLIGTCIRLVLYHFVSMDHYIFTL